jgi:hypothetical protein
MLDDYFLLKEKARHLQRLSTEVERALPAASRINNGTFRSHGVFPDYMQMRTIELVAGGRSTTATMPGRCASASSGMK